jgi:hypothetical protein
VSGHCRKCNGDPNYDCCNGQCYDKRTQKCCKDGEKEWPCDKYKECCNGSCCDPNECESCVDGECKVCGGDTTKKCCPDGSCVKPCELVENKHMCTGETEYCPQRCDVCCDSYYKINYTGNSINACRELGCPGDCQNDVRPICYTRTMCAPWAIPEQACYGSICLPIPGGGGVCFICMHGQYEVEEIRAPYNEKCGH